MRRFALLVLLLSCAACARKAQPVADGGAPEQPVVLPPGADGPPPVEVKPKKALDPNNFAGKSLAQWREDLRSKDRHKIITAMKACEALGPLAADAVPDILAADIDKPKWDPNFGDRTPESHSYYEFQAMKAEVWPGVAKAIGKATIPHLLPLLDVPDEELKDAAREKVYRAGTALFGLRAIGPDAADTIPKLTELLGHTKSGLRDTAARALLDIAGSDKRAVPGLLLALKSDRWVRPRAIDALSRLDPEGTAEQCLAAVTASGWLDHEAMPSEVFVRFGAKGVALAVAKSKRANGAFYIGYMQLVFYNTPPELLVPHVAEIVKWFDTAVRDKHTHGYFGLLARSDRRRKRRFRACSNSPKAATFRRSRQRRGRERRGNRCPKCSGRARAGARKYRPEAFRVHTPYSSSPRVIGRWKRRPRCFRRSARKSRANWPRMWGC